MECEYLVLDESYEQSKFTDKLIDCFGNELSNYSSMAKWMIPNKNARNKMVKLFFNDFVLSESITKSYKLISNVMYKENNYNDDKEKELIGYGLMINNNINSSNSINEEENQYLSFIKLLITYLKYVLLTPLRIGFRNCFAIILFNYNRYLYNNIIFSNLKKSIKQIEQQRNNNNNNSNNNNFGFRQNNNFSSFSNSPNIIQLDYIMILHNYRRRKYGTKFVKHLIKRIYDGYDDKDNNCPALFIECHKNSLLFWRSLGFQIIGIMDNIYYSRKHRSYSMIYHKNRERLNKIVAKSKQLYQNENTLNINTIGLSLDFNDDNVSNIHFKWNFPLQSIMDLIIYLFKFGWLSFAVNKIEGIINFDSSQITNYRIFKWVIKSLVCLVAFWCCAPLLIFIVILRRFNVGAWDKK